MKTLERVSKEEAINALIKAATFLVKEARWAPYHAKINSLRKPLLQLRRCK